MHILKIATLAARGATVVAVLAGLSFAAVESSAPEAQHLNDILERTAGQTSVFLDQFSDVKCIAPDEKGGLQAGLPRRQSGENGRPVRAHHFLVQADEPRVLPAPAL